MPIFEYRCPDCETRFERIVMRSSSRVECPECSNSEVEKLISSFAVSGDSSSRSSAMMDCACNPGTT